MRQMFFVLLAVAPSYVGAGDLIGSEVPPYPDNLKEIGGACIGGPPRTPDVCDYSIGILGDSEEAPVYVYGGKFLRRDDEGHPFWRVIDAMPYPKLPRGHEFAMSTCRENGVDDATIVAVVKITEEEWHTHVLQAFRLDLKQEKFVPLNPKAIECVNEGWGL